jgi:hypothetical protein
MSAEIRFIMNVYFGLDDCCAVDQSSTLALDHESITRCLSPFESLAIPNNPLGLEEPGISYNGQRMYRPLFKSLEE